MDVKRLLTRGGQVFAAEIIDNTEVYKVFIEALETYVPASRSQQKWHCS